MCLAVLPRPALAGSYSFPVYSGGTVVGSDGYNQPYTNTNGTYGGSHTTQGQAGTVNCSGTITATFTWQPAYAGEPPPQQVFVTQTSSAAASFVSQYSQGGSASANDGLGDPSGQTVSGTAYTVQHGGSTVTVTCSPSASATGATGTMNPYLSCSASVGYSVTIGSPSVYLNGATQEGSGKWDILIGQHCIASVVGVPQHYTVLGYSWGVTGTTFKEWDSEAPNNSQASYEVDGPGTLTNATANWYWDDPSQALETVSCTVTLRAPDGSSITCPVAQTVTVMVPDVQATGVGGYMRVVGINDAGNENTYLQAGPTGSLLAGMYWSAVVTTPQTPPFGYGKVEMVQMAIPNESYVTYFTRVNDPDPENDRIGLDSGYPYAKSIQHPDGGVIVPEQVQYVAGDSPQLMVQQGFTGGTPIAYSAQMEHYFMDTLMYEPPNSGQFVPVAFFTWSTDGNATIPGLNDWTKYSGSAGTVSPGSPKAFALNNIFPNWSVIDVFPTF